MCVSHQCFTSHYKTSKEINQDSCCARGWKCEQHVTLRSYKTNIQKHPSNLGKIGWWSWCILDQDVFPHQIFKYNLDQNVSF